MLSVISYLNYIMLGRGLYSLIKLAILPLDKKFYSCIILVRCRFELISKFATTVWNPPDCVH